MGFGLGVLTSLKVDDKLVKYDIWMAVMDPP